jgi:hypothetical protein
MIGSPRPSSAHITRVARTVEKKSPAYPGGASSNTARQPRSENWRALLIPLRCVGSALLQIGHHGVMADHPHTIDRWDDATGENLVEQIAAVGDYLVALATYRAAVQRCPRDKITLRNSAEKSQQLLNRNIGSACGQLPNARRANPRMKSAQPHKNTFRLKPTSAL